MRWRADSVRLRADRPVGRSSSRSANTTGRPAGGGGVCTERNSRTRTAVPPFTRTHVGVFVRLCPHKNIGPAGFAPRQPHPTTGDFAGFHGIFRRVLSAPVRAVVRRRAPTYVVAAGHTRSPNNTYTRAHTARA